MKELKRSNDPVYLSWAEDVLRQHGIAPISLDHHASVLEGSINAIQRRIMVTDEDFPAAEKILGDAEASL